MEINCSLFIFIEPASVVPGSTGTSTGGSTEHTLPIVFDATEDPSINNLTRADVNCDKTGTCYDGEFDCTFFNNIEQLQLKCYYLFYTHSGRPL